ncbi:MAG: hypothetical protein ACTHU0_13585 [Kofleriaceae bacterium]
MWWQRQANERAAEARRQGQLLHLRSADFPCACSWCRNTTLARKLVVYERRDAHWRVHDIMAWLARAPEAEVAPRVHHVFRADHREWRRLCSEKCIREFLSAEREQAVEEFHTCAYCSIRSPRSLANCSNCGAPRAA